MPALFAYICALCVLLGGGYGALNWLAAPEPAYIVPKTPKAKQRSYEAQAEIRRSSSPASSLDVSAAAATSFSAADDKLLSSSNNQSALPESELRVAKIDLGIRSKTAEPVPPQQTRYASSEVSADKAKRTGENASSTQRAVLKKLDRPRPNRTSHRSERKLALMTLRTIQFPDGRQVTQLIPYRGGQRVAFSPNE
jgi:hypothetical protein